MKKLMIFIFGVILLASCQEDEPIGMWDDIIKLSTKSAAFTAQTDSITITTEGNWWWIENITFKDSIYTYYGREDINLESNSYAIIEEDFVVERRDENTLFVKMNENKTSEEQTMRITLEAGDYFDYVTITQAGN